MRKQAISGEPQPVVAAFARLRAISRARWLLIAAIIVVGVGAFFTGRLTAPGLPDTQGPPHVPIPSGANLARWEEYPSDHDQIWYYAVPNSTHESLIAFFKARLPQLGWRCLTENFSTNIQRNGAPLTGSNGYLAGRRGDTSLNINTGDAEFGAFLLQHDLDEGAIAVKIDISATEKPPCA